jgi:hypothetical protein
MKDSVFLMRLGMLFLIFASLWHWLVRPTARFSEGLVDGIAGLLNGIAIGLLLLSIRRRGRQV